MRLVGVEKVYWAAGESHNVKATKATKHLVNGDMRREHERNLINKELSLQKFQMSELQSKVNGGSIQVPFCIPLPDDLPASFFYSGEMMSVI